MSWLLPIKPRPRLTKVIGGVWRCHSPGVPLAYGVTPTEAFAKWEAHWNAYTMKCMAALWTLPPGVPVGQFLRHPGGRHFS